MKKKQSKQEIEEQIEFLKEQHPHLDDSCFEYIRDQALYKEDIEQSKFLHKVESMVNTFINSYLEIINFKRINNFQITNISLN